MDWTSLPIEPLDKLAQTKMQTKLDQLAKPINSLGRLEELADHLAGIYHSTELDLQSRKCLVFAADNGVAQEGVSATPQKVTAIQALNMLAGHTVVATLAQTYHCDIQVIDVGIKADLDSAAIVQKKIRCGTADMLVQPAMTYAQAQQAIQVGFDQAQQAIEAGYQLLAVGELGIGNTTAASAMVAALLHTNGSAVVGKGSNISSQRLKHKIKVVDGALARAALPFPLPDPLVVLQQVGALELGAMTGAILGAAAYQKPVLLDGFLSYASALLAQKLRPTVLDYVIPTHISHEQGSQLVLQALGLKPYIDLEMCVGEGSGAMMILPWLDGLQTILQQMNTQTDMDFTYFP